MTKPRFTPDPLPDGLDPSLASFLQRQFDRMNDWWPKDFEDRVKALEKSYPYIGGTWPIVDYSTVEFNGSASAEQLTETVLALSGGTSARFAANYEVLQDSEDNSFASESGEGVSAYSYVDPLNNYFVIIGSGFVHTQDGTNWTYVDGADLGGLTSFTSKGILYSNGRWVAGCVPSGGGSSTGIRIVESFDLVDWSSVLYDNATIGSAGVGHQIATDGNGKFLVVLYSPITSISSALYSTDDGATWNTTGTLNSSSYGRALTAWYINNTWFMLGNRGYIYRSTDLINWTIVYAEGSSSNFLSAICIAYGGGTYVCVQNAGSGAKLITSTDGINWTNSGPFPTSSLGSLVYDPLLKWGWTSGTDVRKSEDGITWNNVPGSYGSQSGLIMWERKISP